MASERPTKVARYTSRPRDNLHRHRPACGALVFRYRKNVKKLAGSPDIVFTRQKLVVFIDGEFWHGFNWDKKNPRIKSNRGFWVPKIERNMQRDSQNDKFLSDRGWYVMRFWEKQVEKDFDYCIRRIVSYLQEYELNELAISSL